MNQRELLIPYGNEIWTGTPDSILSSLYRNVLNDLGIKEFPFYVKIDKFINRTVKVDDIKELSSIKGNLKKELLKSVMTWKVFIKGLMVLNVEKFDLAIEIKTSDKENNVAKHIQTVVLDPEVIKTEKDLDKIESVLSTVFKQLQFLLGITIERYNELLKNYIIKAKVPNTQIDVSSARGNLNKELKKPTMSWKVFIKGLNFLNVVELNIGVQLYHKNGLTTTHYRTVSFYE